MDVYHKLLKLYSKSQNCKKDIAESVEKILLWCSKNETQILFPELFSPLLQEINNPPAVLYVRGNLDCFRQPALAVVGARKATHYGLACSYHLSRELAAAGIWVVSGLAKGVDGASHRGALSVKKPTAAVMGSGFAHIYPKEHYRLARQILESGGTWITEYPPFDPPVSFHFPMRNRIISGLSLGTLVIEARKKSGSLITALCGLEQGREVFVVPGPICSDLFVGGHELIQNGAKLVTSIRDILEELPMGIKEDSITPTNDSNSFNFGQPFTLSEWIYRNGTKTTGDLHFLIEQGQIFEIAPQRYLSIKNPKPEDSCQIKFS